MKINKKLMAAVLAIAVLSVMAISSFAYEIGYPNKSVYITQYQTVARSGTVRGTHKIFSGDNDACSSRDLYYDAQYLYGDSYRSDTKIRLAPGRHIDPTRTTMHGSTKTWRLELNPYGAATMGCVASGYIWYDM